MRGYWQLTLAQLKLFGRNKTVIFWTTFFPLVLMIALGLFLGGGGSPVLKMGWIDQDQSTESQALEASFRSLSTVDMEDQLSNVQEAAALVEEGELSMVIVVPAGYGEAVAGEKDVPPLEIYYDEVDQGEAQLSFAVLESVLDDENKQLVQFEERITYMSHGVRSANLTYLDFLVPGIIALMILSSNMNGVAAQIASWRERQVLRRFKIAGVSSKTFIAAQITARLILNMSQSLLVLFVGIFLLGAQMNGSWFILLFYIIIGILVFLAIGFIIASLAKTPEHAAPIAGFVTFPMFFLGGIFFPIGNMPDIVQPLVYALPISHLTDALRQVMNVGYGFTELWLPTSVLLLWFVGSFIVSALTFRWE